MKHLNSNVGVHEKGPIKKFLNFLIRSVTKQNCGVNDVVPVGEFITKLWFPLLVLLLTNKPIVFANNVLINNVALTGQNVTAGANNVANNTKVQFDLSWSNSWRTSSGSANWDAVWVFVKYRGLDGIWRHARLSNVGSSVPTGASISLENANPSIAFNASANPVVGAFIYRSSNGSGSVNFTSIQLQWNYGQDGILDTNIVDIRVFAIEMVYVPQGSYSLGSGGTEVSAFYQFPTSTNPYTVASENAITVGAAAGNLYYANSTDGGDRSGPIPLTFPKGFNQFYCMKYEITQNQYVEFLNCLTRNQQENRVATSLGVGVTNVTNRFVMTNSTTVIARNGVRCDANVPASAPVSFYCDLNENGVSNEPDDGLNLAMNYISWLDLGAYLDWSCLRPMTELEYEKACRGNSTPVANEFAWARNTAIGAVTITNVGTSTETTSTISANTACCSTATVLGPLRVGAFANGTTNRVVSGATLYGIMEMSGNLSERCISAGNPEGRAFTGLHGDGSIANDGSGNVLAWPSAASTGCGLRGGNWTLNLNNRVSDRFQAALVTTSRQHHRGGRGARTVY